MSSPLAMGLGHHVSSSPTGSSRRVLRRSHGTNAHDRYFRATGYPCGRSRLLLDTRAPAQRVDAVATVMPSQPSTPSQPPAPDQAMITWVDSVCSADKDLQADQGAARIAARTA